MWQFVLFWSESVFPAVPSMLDVATKTVKSSFSQEEGLWGWGKTPLWDEMWTVCGWVSSISRTLLLGLYWVKTWPSTGSYLRKYSSECVFLEVLEVRGRWGGDSVKALLAACTPGRLRAKSLVCSQWWMLIQQSQPGTKTWMVSGKTTALQSMMVKKV